MTRAEKLAKWEKIYEKCMNVIEKNVGVDKDAVYAACTAITTASREVQIVERVMRTLGEIGAEESTVVLGWEYPKEEQRDA